MPKRFFVFAITILMFLTASGSLDVDAQSSAPKPAAVPMATYSDPAGDVSFDYPAVWKVDTDYQFYMAPRILQGGLRPLVQVLFLPAGNVYAKTNLASLVFAYAKSPQASAEACTALAGGPGSPTPETVAIHGVTFQHFDTGDAGMCHRADQHIYWTYRPTDGNVGAGGTCYLFEGDLQTICPGVVEGQRELTAAENRALTRHLLAIPRSIQVWSGEVGTPPR